MMLASFFLLLLTVDGASSEDNCSYQHLFNHLRLSSQKDLYTMSRPVKHYNTTLKVTLEVLIYAILDMKETDQTFLPYVWIFTSWTNEHITWKPDDFCGLDRIIVPADILWKPDLTIEEMTEKDKTPPSPYLTIESNGIVECRSHEVLVSTCRMQVHKFPFDIQTCNLSFKSVVHNVEELDLHTQLGASTATNWSHGLMQTQHEWLLINQTATSTTVNRFAFDQSMIVYTIKMKRRSILYIVNFLLPILFFLCLDLASFLISDSGGEKLSFKVTVLLAVTVMQLILNEILPSSSDRIPLIAAYCMGVFGLMLVSLLETIVVMYLMEKDSESRDNKADRDQSLTEDCGDKHGKEERKWTCACISDVSADETPSELLKVSSSQLTEESHASEKLSDDLREVVKTLALFLNSSKEEVKPGYWTRMAKTINRVFFIFYIIAASLFLVIMFFKWNTTN
ncbi:5-hydroxytryptamine receptor 3A-like [Thunnus thynnus]|uniref:5-hydroxytryptamine receptor 3A-like n=1 Tax=Thunnus thynnus TaxID=8237 RepID=UPI003526DF26